MVEDDQVVMMDVVVNQVVHQAVYASHHLACRRLALVVKMIIVRRIAGMRRVRVHLALGTSGRCGDDGGVLKG